MNNVVPGIPDGVHDINDHVHRFSFHFVDSILYLVVENIVGVSQEFVEG